MCSVFYANEWPDRDADERLHHLILDAKPVVRVGSTGETINLTA